jgi:hypothetical protein
MSGSGAAERPAPAVKEAAFGVAVWRDTTGPQCLEQQHERQQAHHLWLVWHERGQEPSQADRLGTQVLATKRSPELAA